jgi:hypothetical protein
MARYRGGGIAVRLFGAVRNSVFGHRLSEERVVLEAWVDRIQQTKTLRSCLIFRVLTIDVFDVFAVARSHTLAARDAIADSLRERGDFLDGMDVTSGRVHPVDLLVAVHGPAF